MNNLTPEQLAVLANEDLGPLTQSIVIAFTSLAIIAVGLRFFTRMILVRIQLGWEDYVILASLVTAIVCAVFQILQVQSGNGKHAMFIHNPNDLVNILKYLFWSIIFYQISICCTKVSILLQYERVFISTRLRMPLYITIAIVVIWGIAISISISVCSPPPTDLQSVMEKNSKCIEDWIMWYIIASVNIFTDLLVAVLPIRVVWKLQMAKRHKIALISILSIGWFVCLVSVLRLHALVILVAHQEDSTYYSAPAAYWSAIEVNLAIVCASLPALKPLVTKIIPSFSSSKGSSSNSIYGLSRNEHSKSKASTFGIKTTARRADVENIELATSTSMTFPNKSNKDIILGKDIYVSQHLEQHYDDYSHLSDSGSQKDLVNRH